MSTFSNTTHVTMSLHVLAEPSCGSDLDLQLCLPFES